MFCMPIWEVPLYIYIDLHAYTYRGRTLRVQLCSVQSRSFPSKLRANPASQEPGGKYGAGSFIGIGHERLRVYTI